MVSASPAKITFVRKKIPATSSSSTSTASTSVEDVFKITKPPMPRPQINFLLKSESEPIIPPTTIQDEEFLDINNIEDEFNMSAPASSLNEITDLGATHSNLLGSSKSNQNSQNGSTDAASTKQEPNSTTNAAPSTSALDQMEDIDKSVTTSLGGTHNGDLHTHEINHNSECFVCKIEHSQKEASQKFSILKNKNSEPSEGSIIENEEDVFLEAKKSSSVSFKDKTPSVVVKLYNNNFTLEAPQPPGASASKQKDQSSKIVLTYNHATRTFLRNIATGRITPDFWDDIQSFPLHFYDGSIIVKVIDLREEQQNQMKLQMKQKQKSTTPSTASASAANGTAAAAKAKRGKKASVKSENNTNFDVTLGIDDSKVESYEMLLHQDSNFLQRDIDEFLAEQFPESQFTQEEKLNILQKVLHLTNDEGVCLDPSPVVCKVANLLYYNKQKFNFRRRRTRHVARNSSRYGPSRGVIYKSALMGPRNSVYSANKPESTLINFISQNGWKTTQERMAEQQQVSTGTSSTKQKKPKKRQTSILSAALQKSSSAGFIAQGGVDPMAFSGSTIGKVQHNIKPPNRARLLEFQATHEKRRVWRVQILPIMGGKKYEALLSPANNEHSSRWILGSRHAMELYVARLKDMFTSSGKTKCINDKEIEYQPPATPNPYPSAATSVTASSAPVAANGTATTAANPQIGAAANLLRTIGAQGIPAAAAVAAAAATPAAGVQTGAGRGRPAAGRGRQAPRATTPTNTVPPGVGVTPATAAVATTAAAAAANAAVGGLRQPATTPFVRQLATPVTAGARAPATVTANATAAATGLRPTGTPAVATARTTPALATAGVTPAGKQPRQPGATATAGAIPMRRTPGTPSGATPAPAFPTTAQPGAAGNIVFNRGAVYPIDPRLRIPMAAMYNFNMMTPGATAPISPASMPRTPFNFPPTATASQTSTATNPPAKPAAK